MPAIQSIAPPLFPLQIHQYPGKGPPLVALHGFTGSGPDFAPLAATVGEHLCCPDLPGHGLGAPDHPASWFSLAGAAGVLATWLDGAPPVDLLGYSLGARTALQLALDHPGRVRRLILVGATAGIASEDERAERRALDGARAARILSNGVPAFAAEWAAHPLIASQSRIAEPHHARMAQRRRGNHGPGLAASLRGMGTGSMDPLWHRLATLPHPTTIIVGEGDSKYRALAQQMGAAIPRAAVHIVPGAGHAAHLERPDRVAPLIHAARDQT
jgi:2-succinyl-6-hydroxy-2,4-cyclohexadiene-1-carboxylate synthase